MSMPGASSFSFVAIEHRILRLVGGARRVPRIGPERRQRETLHGPVVEPGRGGPGVRPRPPHRADPPGDDLPPVAKGTIEERIVALHHHKRDLAEWLLEGADAPARLDASELLELLRRPLD